MRDERVRANHDDKDRRSVWVERLYNFPRTR
jgi:hypothetical protein